jgi:tryptophan synthase alpha chain
MQNDKMPVMGHLVIGYPNLAESIATAESYIRAGIAILELQIPFSHPTADGAVITEACREAVEVQKVSVDDSLSAIQTLRERYPAQEMVVMSYINRIFAYGLPKFAAAMQRSGIRYLIVPDLPVDSDVARQLTDNGLMLIPVLAANITPVRLADLLAMDFDLFYLMSDFKITGSGFSLNPRLQEIVQAIKAAHPAARTGIGFGISTPEQAQMVCEVADFAIIGSALITAQQAGRLAPYLDQLATALDGSLLS